MNATTGNRKFELPRGTVLEGLHIATLAGFAFAQPLFETLGPEPTFFIAHRTEPGILVLFATLVTVGPAVALWLLLRITALGGQRSATAARTAVVAFLVALALLPAVHRTGFAGGKLAVACGVAGGAAFALAYHRLALLRTFVTFLTPVILIFPGLLLLYSPTARLLRPVATAENSATSPIDATTPVVLVVFDELPLTSLLDDSEQIDAVRYPAFAELARGSSWYRRATTVANYTDLALPAIVTGRYPESNVHASLRYHPQNLFTWLGGSYEMQVIEALTLLCPTELISDSSWIPDRWQSWRLLIADTALVYLHIVLPRELTVGLPNVTASWKEFAPGAAAKRPAADSTDRRQTFHARSGDHAGLHARFLKMLASGSDSTLYFMHLMMPHFPWKLLPSGKEYGGVNYLPTHPDPRRSGDWPDDELQTLQAYQHHLLQVGYADRQLGEIIATLRETGLWDRGLIVLTADHGITFQAGSTRRGFAPEEVQDVLSVPLFIKRPGQTQGEESDAQVELTDILPTIADVLGIAPPWPVDGRPVDDPAVAGRLEKVVFSSGVGKAAVFERRAIAVGALAGRASLDRKLEAFSSGDLFAIGPHRDLLGEPVVVNVSAGANREVTVDLFEAWTYDNVDPQARFLPAHVTGKIIVDPAGDGQGIGPGHELAVALNGRIHALTRAYFERNGEMWFSAMVPEAAFVPGHNALEVFVVVDQQASGRRLIPTNVQGRLRPEFLLATGAGGQIEIRDRDGEALRISPEDIRGRAETNGMGYIGWAVDRRSPGQPVDILVFLGGRLVAWTPAAGPVFPVLEKDPDLDLDRAGFNLAIRFGQLPAETSTGDLRLFAVHDGAAVELAVRFVETLSVWDNLPAPPSGPPKPTGEA